MDWQQQYPLPSQSQAQISPPQSHHLQQQQQSRQQQPPQAQQSNQLMYSYNPDLDEPQRPYQQQQQQQPYRPSLQSRSHSASYLQSGSGEALSHSHSHSHSHSLSHPHSPTVHASTSSSSFNTTPSSSYTPSTSTSYYIRGSRSCEFDAPPVTAGDRPGTCDNVWIHSEHRDLSTRYTKALEDLATSRSDVIRLTTELASVHARISSLASPSPSAPPSPVLQHVPVHAPPRPPPAPCPAAPSPASVTTPISPIDPFAAMKASFAGRPSPVSTTSIGNTPPSRLDMELPSPIEFSSSSSHSPIPLSASRGARGGSGRARYYNAPTLPSQPPDPNVMNQYLAELGSWSRPRYDYTQLMHVHNYSNDAAVKSNLRTEMVDLEGICPTPAQWKLWILVRLTIVKDLLDPGKSWKNQRDQDKRLAVQIVEKRFPALALCEPDRCWKAAIFLQRRLDEAIKTGHETERRKGANSVNNTLGITHGSAPTFQGTQAMGQWDGKNEAGRTHEEGGWSMMMNI